MASAAYRPQAPASPLAQAYVERWQDRYALPGWEKRLTRLTPQQEAQFKAWVNQHSTPVTDDYDMRGFWLNHGQSAINPNDRQIHYPDTWKTPLHQSFSAESIYANPRVRGPTWNERDQLVAPDGTILFDERRR